MRNISFALTTPQIRAKTKTVTRRLGWKNVGAGDVLQGIEKGQGLKKGEHPVKLAQIYVRSASREPLRVLIDNPPYGNHEVVCEGFPYFTPREFVEMFCKHNGCTPDTVVTRIEFEYL